MMFDKLNRFYIVIGVLVIIGTILAYNMLREKPIHNEGFVSEQSATVEGVNDVNDLIDKLNEEEIKEHPIISGNEPIDQATVDKLNWKNQFMGRKSNFKDGQRGNVDVGDWDEYYNTNSDLVDKSYIQNNDGFIPSDETKGNLASYSGQGHSKHTPEDLFVVDKLLPQETNADWFETMPEPIKVKNRHLVNVTRPVGVSTIGGSLKIPNYDIRPSPPCPKFVVSPWMNSSVEQDLNIKGL